MTTNPNWKPVGQIAAHMLDLVNLARTTLSNQGIGPDFLPWLLKGQNEDLLTGAIEKIGEVFLAQQRRIADNLAEKKRPSNLFRRIGPNAMLVNLDIVPLLYEPSRWKILHNPGGGIVLVERRGEEIFIGGRRVLLYQHPSQLTKPTHCVYDDRLLEVMKGHDTLHPNLLEAMLHDKGTFLTPLLRTARAKRSALKNKDKEVFGAQLLFWGVRLFDRWTKHDAFRRAHCTLYINGDIVWTIDDQCMNGICMGEYDFTPILEKPQFG